MRSTMRTIAPALTLLALAGCAGSFHIAASPSACSKLLPGTWRDGIAVANLPTIAANASELDTQKAWEVYGIDMAGRLEQANGRIGDIFGIYERCEERDAKAIKAARPKFLGIL